MKFGLYYVESPFVTSYEKEIGADYDALCTNFFEEMALADQCGFEEVMACEHHFSQAWWPSPIMVAVAAALRTTRIKVGTCIALVPLHNPVSLAEQSAIADILSKGRFILGVGQGYRPVEFEAFGAPIELRGRRLEEGVDIIKRLWTEPAVDIASKYWPGLKVKNLTLVPQPYQKPRPPIWIGAWAGEKSARRAARIVASGPGFDKWMPDTLFPFEQTKKLLNAYTDELKKQGARYTDETKPVFYNEGYITTTDEDAAWQEVKPHLIRTYSVYQEWSHYPPDTTGTTTERDRDYKKTLDMEEVLTRTVRPRMLLGSPDDCISRVSELEKELGMNRVIFRIHHHGLSHRKVMEQIRLFGEKVIPYFDDRDRK